MRKSLSKVQKKYIVKTVIFAIINSALILFFIVNKVKYIQGLDKIIGALSANFSPIFHLTIILRILIQI